MREVHRLDLESDPLVFRYLLCNDLLALPKIGVALETPQVALQLHSIHPEGSRFLARLPRVQLPSPGKQATGNRMQKLFREKENWEPKHAGGLFQ